MKIISLDVGEKRIGVATADSTVKIATPHSTIIVDGTEFEQIKKLMAEEGTNFVVVGLPRNTRGAETAQSEITRLFATELQSRGARIKFQDETLTSVEAERRLKSRKKPFAKEQIDAEAATIILQDFLEEFREDKTKPTPGLSQHVRAKVGDPERAVSGGRREGDPIEDLSEMGRDTTDRTRNTHDDEPTFAPKNSHSSAKTPFRTLLPHATVIIVFLLASAASIWFFSGTVAIRNTPLRQPFTISQGESTDTIAKSLYQAGLIKNPTTFALAAKLTGANIPATTRYLSPSQTTWQILDQLTGKQTD